MDPHSELLLGYFFARLFQIVWTFEGVFGLYVQIRLYRRAEEDRVFFRGRAKEYREVADPTPLTAFASEEMVDAARVALAHKKAALRHMAFKIIVAAVGIVALASPIQRPATKVTAAISMILIVALALLVQDGLANLRNRTEFFGSALKHGPGR